MAGGSNSYVEGTIFPSITSLYTKNLERSRSGYLQANCSKAPLFRPVDWDVFVRDLNRQLGTPSHWLPVDSCKKEQKGALAAVFNPTLKSASKKHQNGAPPSLSTAYGTLKVLKMELCLVCMSPSGKAPSLVPCA